MRIVIILSLLVSVFLVACSDDEQSNPAATEIGLDSLLDIYIITLFIPLDIQDTERVLIDLYDVEGHYRTTLLSRDLVGVHAIYQNTTAVLLTDGEHDEVLLRHEDCDSGAYFIKLWVGSRQITRSLVIPPDVG